MLATWKAAEGVEAIEGCALNVTVAGPYWQARHSS
jgi:hypothetical protein